MDFILSDFNMSLTYFLMNGFQLNAELYGCPEDPELRPYGVRRPFWGVYFFFSGIFILALYIICFIAIATSDLMRTPAYKTMIVLGIYDIPSTCIHSVATGIFGYSGISFCDFPRMIFIFGSIGLGSWMGCCISSLTLALIRICDMGPTMKIRNLFKGQRIYFSFFYFGYMSWFFDPKVGKDPKLYINLAHTFNNGFMALGTVLFYGYLALLALNKFGENTVQLSKYQINVSNLIMIGSVCIVYLTLNRSIRRSVSEMILPQTAIGPMVTLSTGSQIFVSQIQMM
uniref:Transmembrane protein 144 n=1 Tax=Caenorhabditis tropicalis TaxID=1561998 RepID=A0A1I7TY15_9PELO